MMTEQTRAGLIQKVGRYRNAERERSKQMEVLKAEIRKAHAEGASANELIKVTGLARNTVFRTLRQG